MESKRSKSRLLMLALAGPQSKTLTMTRKTGRSNCQPTSRNLIERSTLHICSYPASTRFDNVGGTADSDSSLEVRTSAGQTLGAGQGCISGRASETPVLATRSRPGPTRARESSIQDTVCCKAKLPSIASMSARRVAAHSIETLSYHGRSQFGSLAQFAIDSDAHCALAWL